MPETERIEFDPDEEEPWDPELQTDEYLDLEPDDDD